MTNAQLRTLKKFIRTASESVSYTVEPKAAFHSQGRAVLKMLAAALELPESTFEIRSNKGGIAVSGEVTLHGENIYVQLSQSVMAGGKMDVLFRTVMGRKDYTGGRNNFMAISDLLNWNFAVCRIRQVMDKVMFQVCD